MGEARRKANKPTAKIGGVYKMAENNKPSGGIGFCGLLAIVFITLKLAKVINWSWLWVLSPVWIPAAFVLAIAIVIVIVRTVKTG
jgi:hypothetical protein